MRFLGWYDWPILVWPYTKGQVVFCLRVHVVMLMRFSSVMIFDHIEYGSLVKVKGYVDILITILQSSIDEGDRLSILFTISMFDEIILEIILYCKRRKFTHIVWNWHVKHVNYYQWQFRLKINNKTYTQGIYIYFSMQFSSFIV